MKRRSFLKCILGTTTMVAVPALAKTGGGSSNIDVESILEARKAMDASPVPTGNRFIPADEVAKEATKIFTNAFNEGDIITMQGVTKPDGSLQQFKVTEVARNESTIIQF